MRAGPTNADCSVEMVERAPDECLFSPLCTNGHYEHLLNLQPADFLTKHPPPPPSDTLMTLCGAQWTLHDAYVQLVTLAGSNVKLFSFGFVWSCFTVCDGGFFPLSSPQSKRRFERDCKEADRAQQYFERMDADINVTKADVEKVLFVSTSSPTLPHIQSCTSPHTPTQHLPHSLLRRGILLLQVAAIRYHSKAANILSAALKRGFISRDPCLVFRGLHTQRGIRPMRQSPAADVTSCCRSHARKASWVTGGRPPPPAARSAAGAELKTELTQFRTRL